MINKKVLVIAKNTFTEIIRERVLYAVLGFAALLIAATLLAGSVSLGQDVRVIQTFGLTAILVFLLSIAIFLATQLLRREADQRIIHLTLSKPVSRETYFLGKFAGICSVLLVCAGIMAAILVILLWIKTGAFPGVTAVAVVAIALEVWLVTALGMLFSSFARPLIAIVSTFGLVLVGHSVNTIWLIAEKSTPAVKYALQAAYYGFPNLEKFNLRNDAVYGLSPDLAQGIGIIGYFLGYTLLLLVLGLLAFRRHES